MPLVNGATVCVEPRPTYDAKLPGLKRIARPKQVSVPIIGESRLEDDLYHQLRMAGLPLPETQYQFADKRRWRFDFAWPDRMLAVEVEGGVWTRGRHQRPLGFLGDCEKYNVAAIRGWTVIRVAAPHINNGKALMWVEAALDMPNKMG